MFITPPNKMFLGISTAFGLLTLILAGAGLLILGRMTRIEAQARELLSKQRAKIELSEESIRCSARNNRITMEILLRNDRKEIPELLAERAKNTDRISELLKQLSDKGDSADETKLITAVWERRNPYIDSYKEALALYLEQHKYEEAKAKMVKVTLPRLVDYHEAWTKLLDFQKARMEKTEATVRAHFQAARRQVLWLLGLGGSAAAAFLFFTALTAGRTGTTTGHSVAKMQTLPAPPHQPIPET